MINAKGILPPINNNTIYSEGHQAIFFTLHHKSGIKLSLSIGNEDINEERDTYLEIGLAFSYELFTNDIVAKYLFFPETEKGGLLKRSASLFSLYIKEINYSKASFVFQTSQTFPTKSGPGFKVCLPGFQPEGVASVPLLFLTN